MRASPMGDQVKPLHKGLKGENFFFGATLLKN